MNRYLLPIVIEKDDDGYFVSCPTLQGYYTQGNTNEEAMANIRDAVLLHIEDRLANCESVPSSGMVSLAALEVVAGASNYRVSLQRR